MLFLQLIFIGIPFILGVFIMYCMYRFRRHSIVDKTAGPLSLLFVIWDISMYPLRVHALYPYISLDLREMIGARKDDGEIT